MEAYSYSAFISYRHTLPDEAIAKKLHTYIETYSIPREIRRASGKKKMGRVFRDQEELPLSTDLSGDIRTALENSEWLIAICSPQYLQSRWCMAELDYFISLGRKDHVLVILAEGEPRDSFPQQLRYSLVDGKWVEVEPLAGDVRADSLDASLKRLRNEKLRILAPMLGVNYDQLRQRARKRRMRIIGTAAAAGFVLLAGFLTYALIKNGQVARQRDIAVENEEEMLVQRDLARDNQMQLLIGQANISVADGNKLSALDSLREAAGLRASVGGDNDAALRSALEYALYNDKFEAIQTVKGHNRKFESMIFSHNDQYLIGVSNLNSANLIDAVTGEILYTVARNDTGQISGVGFTPDDKYFYMVDSWYGYVSLYDVGTGELYREYNDDSDTTWMIGDDVFPLSDGRLLINERNSLLLWNYVEDTYENFFATTDSAFGLTNIGALKYVVQSPDLTKLVFGSNGYGDGMMILSLEDKQVTYLEQGITGGCMNLNFSGDGSYVSAWYGKSFCVWDASTGKRVYTDDKNDYTSALLNTDGSQLIVTDADALSVVEIRSGKTLWQVKADTESSSGTTAMLSPDGKYITCSGGVNGTYDAATGEKLSDSVGAAFSHDSSLMLVNPYAGTPKMLITPEAASVRQVGDYNKELFTTPRWTQPMGMIGLTAKHQPAEQYLTGPNSVNRKSFIYTSPDLYYAAHTAVDGFIEIYNISDPENVKEIACVAELCYYSVTDGMFNGKLFAACGGFDPRCVLFDIDKGNISYVLPGVEYIHSCEFSKDGSKIILLCGYSRNVALVYTTESGNLLYRFDAPEGKSFEKIGFTEDGAEVAAVMEDGTAVVGDLYPTLDDLMKAAAGK